MRRYLSSVALFLFLVAVTLTGCTKPALREKPPPDPLLTSKKPVEGRSHISDSRSIAEDDYSPPPRPSDDERPVRGFGARPAGQR